MIAVLHALAFFFGDLFKSRRRLEAETYFFGISSISLYAGHSLGPIS